MNYYWDVRLPPEKGTSDDSPEMVKALQQRYGKEPYETAVFDVDGWRGRVRLNKEALIFARSTEVGNILNCPAHLEIKRTRWDMEIFYRHPDGLYHSTAVILDYSKNHVTLTWDKFGVERFERGNDGKFCKK